MTVSQSTAPRLSPDATRVKIGLAIAAVGGFLEAAGVAIAGIEVALATRRWARELERPPSEAVRERLRQAMRASQAARHAATEVWRTNGEGEHVVSWSRSA